MWIDENQSNSRVLTRRLKYMVLVFYKFVTVSCFYRTLKRVDALHNTLVALQQMRTNQILSWLLSTNDVAF